MAFVAAFREDRADALFEELDLVGRRRGNEIAGAGGQDKEERDDDDG